MSRGLPEQLPWCCGECAWAVRLDHHGVAQHHIAGLGNVLVRMNDHGHIEREGGACAFRDVMWHHAAETQSMPARAHIRLAAIFSVACGSDGSIDGACDVAGRAPRQGGSKTGVLGTPEKVIFLLLQGAWSAEHQRPA